MKTLCVLVLIGAGVVTALGQSPSEKRVGPPTHSAQTPQWPHRSTVTVYMNGHMLSTRGLSENRNEPNLFLWDNQGQVVFQALFWPFGAARVSIADASVTPWGTVVASGTAWQTDQTAASYIAEVDRTGTTRRIIQTNPFGARRICATPDGFVWAFGNAKGDGKGLLRKYSFETGVAAKFLDDVDFAPTKRPANLLPGKPVSIHCNADRITVFSGRTGEVIVLHPAKGNIERWRVDYGGLPSATAGGGVAVTSSGKVFAHLFREEPGLHLPLGLYALHMPADSASAFWVPVLDQPENPDHRLGRVLGAEGEELVFTRVRSGRVHWARAE